jgi:hypothetical protein
MLTPALLALAVLIAAPAVSLAQRIIIPVRTIPTPQLMTPASSATINATSPNLTSATFVWRESGLFSYGTVQLPSYFIVCLRLQSEPQTCDWSTANWSGAATAIPHSTYSVGMPFGNPVGYQYTFVPPTNVLDTYLDRAVNWIVGACGSANPAYACVNSAPQPIWFSAQDLVGENTGARPLSNALRLRANGRNAGTTTTPAFTATFDAYQVLLDAVNQCRKDANSADVMNDGTVRAIMLNGDVLTLAQVPRTGAGTIDTTNIVALRRTTLFSGSMSVNVNPGLSPNTIPTQLIEWDVPTPTRPMGLASILKLDTTGTVREQSEVNNVNVECNVAQ